MNLYTPAEIEEIVIKGTISIIGAPLAELNPFVGNWTNTAFDHYPPLLPSNASSTVIALLMVGQDTTNSPYGLIDQGKKQWDDCCLITGTQFYMSSHLFYREFIAGFNWENKAG